MMKFEIGKFYRTHDGRKVKCVSDYVSVVCFREEALNSSYFYVFRSNGKRYEGPLNLLGSYDIISEWEEPKLEVGKKYININDSNKENPTVYIAGCELPDGSVILWWVSKVYEGYGTRACEPYQFKDYKPLPEYRTVWIGVRRLGISPIFPIFVYYLSETPTFDTVTYRTARTKVPFDYDFSGMVCKD